MKKNRSIIFYKIREHKLLGNYNIVFSDTYYLELYNAITI